MNAHRGAWKSAVSRSHLATDQRRLSVAYDKFPFAFDTVWTAGLLLAILYNPQLKSLTPAIVIVLFVVVMAVRVRAFLTHGAYASIILIIPAFALLSSFWSIDPSATIRYGSLYAVTVLCGIMMGAAANRGQMLSGIFIAFFVYALSAVAFGSFSDWGADALGNAAFTGLANSKNASGDTAAIGLLSSFAMLSLSMQRRWALAALCALAIIPVQLWILRESNATGSFIAGLAASFCVTCWLLSQKLDSAIRSTIFIFITTSAIIAALTQSLWLPALFETVLESSGKNAGLTGRAYLWDRGWQLIAENPFAGLGFGAFWIHGNLDAEGLWRFAQIGSRSGFNFHSTLIETLVHLGYLGLAIFALIFVPLLALLFMRTMMQPHPAAIFFCGLATYEMMRMSFESLAFAPIHFTTVLIFACIASAVYKNSSTSSAVRTGDIRHAQIKGYQRA